MNESPPSPFQVLARFQAKPDARCLIVGGFAVNTHGFTRFTADVDCLIVMEDSFRLAAAFQEAGYTRRPAAATCVSFHHPNAQPKVVDILLVSQSTFEKMWEGRVPAKFENLDFAVPDMEHIFAMKFHSVKSNPARFGKDMRDVHELVRAHPEIATREKVVKLCREFGPPDRQDEILQYVLAYADD